MRFDRVMEVVAVVIIAMILIGEVIVYTTGQDKYSSSAELNGDVLSYSISADGSETFFVLLMDNGPMDAMTELYVYFDENYKSNYEEVEVAIGAKPLDQEYYIEQLVKQLEYRGAVKVTVLNAEELSAAMDSDIANGDYTKGLVVISGALPDTVYTGLEDDKVFEWMELGGRLYWLGNLLGSCYATEDELNYVDNYQMLFFGTQCLNTEGVDDAESDVSTNDLRYALSLSSNSVKYGIDVEALTNVKGADNVLALGYSEEGYASIVMTSFGKGMICVIGGDYSNYQRGDLAQVISSQICYRTELIENFTGSVTRDTVRGEYDMQGPHGNLAVYIYLGGYYPVYGEFYSL